VVFFCLAGLPVGKEAGSDPAFAYEPKHLRGTERMTLVEMAGKVTIMIFPIFMSIAATAAAGRQSGA
jgi:hypothetical protein